MSILVPALAFLLGISLPHWIIQRDERRLTGIELRRSWPRSTHWSAIIGFSWLAVPVHFVKTRRSWKGGALGLGWLIIGVALQILAVSAAQAFLGAWD